jgi:hypothetical protein
MARGSAQELSPWNRRSLTIPPDSLRTWVQLATWEIWMGMLVCVSLGLGVMLIATSSDRIVTVADLTNCYGPPPVTLPCERMMYRGGVLNAAFTALCGVMLVGLAAWLLWELWSAVEPKPITNDFLRLLHDSFGRDWRNPFTWPWARVLWAYGFTAVGVTVTTGVGLMIWTLVASSESAKVPTVRIHTSQSYRLGQ